MTFGFRQPGHVAMQEQGGLIEETLERARLSQIHCLAEPLQVALLFSCQFPREKQDERDVGEVRIILYLLNQLESLCVGQIERHHRG